MKHAGNAFKYLSLLLMLLLFPCQETLAQNGNVKGTVVADDGPVIGATVRVKGQPNAATVTDLDGNFVLKAPKGATLQISYLGYKDKEIKVGNGPIDVTLESDAQALNEVVVVGYGQMKRADLTGSVAYPCQRLSRAVSPSGVCQTTRLSTNTGSRIRCLTSSTRTTSASGLTRASAME